MNNKYMIIGLKDRNYKLYKDYGNLKILIININISMFQILNYK